MIEHLITFLLFILAGSAWIHGVSTLFDEGMILERVGIWLDENGEEWGNKPIWRCPICMSSVHGSAIYFIFLFPVYGWFIWPVFCICLCGVNSIVRSMMP